MARDLVCLSHLRWDFVYQRPNHLMARAGVDRRVFFVEEPVVERGAPPSWRLVDRGGVTVATPVICELDERAKERTLSQLLAGLVRLYRIDRPVAWFYTPMAWPWARDLAAVADAVVYDSMDYLAGFRGASPRLLELESALLARADLVFAGGVSLGSRLRRRHAACHTFPSSIDLAHFTTARDGLPDPVDQASVGRPRIGYAGVIDERIDLALVDGVAAARPDLEIVLVGPVAKLDPAELPDRPNVHRLGLKPYAELPSYLAGWDVGWMPFARNEATRYISPTKTPEYLAAGLPVVSTSIHDVVDPYGRLGLVTIADDVPATVAGIDAALAGQRPRLADVDAFLATGSWDRTWAAMNALVEAACERPDRRRSATVDRSRGVRRGTPVSLPARPEESGRGSVPVAAAARQRVPAGASSARRATDGPAR